MNTANRLFCLISLPLLLGCASITVTHQAENKKLAPQPPKLTNASPTYEIAEARAVAPRGISNAKLRQKTLFLTEQGHIYAEDPLGEKTPLGAQLNQAIDKTLQKAFQGHEPGNQHLKIETRITKEIAGSRALRAVIGLGTGKTTLETKTLVFNSTKSSTQPWLEIWTSGGSNREPGAIFAAMPSPIPILNIGTAVGVAASLTSGSSKGLTQDARRTGRMIGGTIANALRLHQWDIPKQKTKQKGQ